MAENYQRYFESLEERYDVDPYPYRDPNKQGIYVTATEYLGKINHYCFNGQRDLRNKHRFLIAGGGTGDATMYLAEQLRNSDSEIVYVDISTGAMKVAQERARVRGLENIQWVHGSLLDVPEMGLGEFDYINCSGVLHHLEDPLEALRALSRVLKDDGCMGLLVYAKYGRASLYNIQALMQIVNAATDDTPEMIDHTKTVLNNLEEDHWLLRDKERWQMELEAMGVAADSDTGLYHLFLHEDHSFSISQLYQWVEQGGLQLTKLTGFPGHTRKYNPADQTSKHDFTKLMNDMPEHDRQAAGELLNGGILSHTIYVSRANSTIADNTNLSNIPYIPYKFATAEQLFTGLDNNPGKSMNIKMGEGPDDMLIINQNKYTKYLIKFLDGNRTLEDILTCAMQEIAKTDHTVDKDELMSDYLKLYNDFDDWDMIILRDKNIPHFNRSDEL